MKSARLWMIGALVVGMAGASYGEDTKAAEEPGGHATLRDATGKQVGTARLEETPNGVLISLDIEALPAGVHALHIHETGKCEAPFASAGGHFNPMGKEHGMKNAKGMHAGDFPNVVVPEDGKLKISVLAGQVTLEKGANSLFDEDGSALVIHSGADDYSSDPAGNAGPRIACGVIEQ